MISFWVRTLTYRYKLYDKIWIWSCVIKLTSVVTPATLVYTHLFSFPPLSCHPASTSISRPISICTAVSIFCNQSIKTSNRKYCTLMIIKRYHSFSLQNHVAQAVVNQQLWWIKFDWSYDKHSKLCAVLNIYWIPYSSIRILIPVQARNYIFENMILV